MLVTAAANALSIPSPLMIGHYDFGYASYGDPQVRPVQVFDDGAGTMYFQIRPGEPMPAVFAGPDLSLLLTQAQGTYFTANSTATEFTLALGNARAVVVRALEGQRPASVLRGLLAERGAAASSWQSRPIASALPGLPAGALVPRPAPRAAPGNVGPDAEPAPWRDQPVLFTTGSAVLGDAVHAALAALVGRIGPQASIEVQGLGDLTPLEPLARRRAEALRDALVGQGVSAHRIRLRAAGVAANPPAAESPGAEGIRQAAGIVWWQEGREPTGLADPMPSNLAAAPAATSSSATFEILRTDRTISGSLRRWGKRAGYSVAWEAALDAPLTGDLSIEADSFLDAVQQVVDGLQAQGYPIRALASEDRVVRFTRVQ